MKNILILVPFILMLQVLHAQDEKDEKEEKGKFRKENFFTGGSLSLSFGDNSFMVGGTPVFGYSLAKWVDIGLVGNYNYTSYRDYFTIDDKLRQTVYGGGFFTRLFPARFIFAQGQVERNWIRLKYIPPFGAAESERKVTGNSILVGAGFTSGRDPDAKNIYGFLCVLYDVSKDVNSPYTDSRGRSIPIFRAGFHIP